jgi:hypothetical protein
LLGFPRTDTTESVIRGDHYGQSNDWQGLSSNGEKGCEEGSQEACEESREEDCQEVRREKVGEKEVVLAFS